MEIETISAEDGMGEVAEKLARSISLVFVFHDRGAYEKAVAAQEQVDEYQFKHLSDDEVERAAEKYVQALWAKDEIESKFEVTQEESDGIVFEDDIEASDWSAVRELLEERARIVGMNVEYGRATKDGWRLHKTPKQYEEHYLEAQMYEFRVAIQNFQYPEKPRSGQAGYGPEPALYLAGVEIHDLRMEREHQFSRAVQTMQLYFSELLRRQQMNGFPLHPE